MKINADAGKISTFLLVLPTLILTGLLASRFITSAFAVPAQHIPVRICHATHSNTNPFESITVDDDSVDGIGPADHNRDGHQDGEDIIPPGPWDADGRNWDATGQAIWNNNCNTPSVSPTPTPSGNPSATPTGTPVATPTATPYTTPSGTPEPTATPCNGVCGNTGGGGGNNPTPTPTATPTAVPSGTPAATATPTPPQGGPGGGDGLGCATHDCSGNQANPASGSQGSVLGATTYANTGALENMLMNLVLTFGVATFLLGFMVYAKKA